MPHALGAKTRMKHHQERAQLGPRGAFLHACSATGACLLWHKYAFTSGPADLPDCIMATENTTKKNSTFLSTPLNSVTSLAQIPGVGGATLEKLTRAGVTTPSQLIGQFLLLNKHPEAMRQWLQTACAVRPREGALIANALAEKTGRMEML